MVTEDQIVTRARENSVICSTAEDKVIAGTRSNGVSATLIWIGSRDSVDV